MTKQEIKDILHELYLMANFSMRYADEINEALNLTFKAIDAYDEIPQEECNNEKCNSSII